MADIIFAWVTGWGPVILTLGVLLGMLMGAPLGHRQGRIEGARMAIVSGLLSRG